MRIAILHPFLYREPRGIERFTFNLANAWAVRGDEIHLVTWRWPQPIAIDALDPAVQVHVMPTARYYTALTMGPLYAWHLWRQAYDFVWIHFAGYGEAEALTLLCRQPFGVIFHFPYRLVPHRYQEFRRYGLIKRARHLVSVSTAVARGVQEAFGQASTIIHHGVNTARFAPDETARARVRQQLGLPLETNLILTTAALEARKGVQWVLRALPQVLQAQPQTHYLVAGAGPHRAALEALAQVLGVAAQVHWLGPQADVVPYLQAADVFAILARGEASSLAALEALACGLPVVAAQQPPFDELITPACGVLVNETNANAVAWVITHWLSDALHRAALGAAGRAHVLANFTWSRAAAQFAAVLAERA